METHERRAWRGRHRMRAAWARLCLFPAEGRSQLHHPGGRVECGRRLAPCLGFGAPSSRRHNGVLYRASRCRRPSTAIPRRDAVIAYLGQYEKRYAMAVERPVKVMGITRDSGLFTVTTDRGPRRARRDQRHGNLETPVPAGLLGPSSLRGASDSFGAVPDPDRIHRPARSERGRWQPGAQILAELSLLADVTWVTPTPPLFLPDGVDGRVLFERATARWRAAQEGRWIDVPAGGLGDIVMVPQVKDARAHGNPSRRRALRSLRRRRRGLELAAGPMSMP